MYTFAERHNETGACSNDSFCRHQPVTRGLRTSTRRTLTDFVPPALRQRRSETGKAISATHTIMYHSGPPYTASGAKASVVVGTQEGSAGRTGQFTIMDRFLFRGLESAYKSVKV